MKHLFHLLFATTLLLGSLILFNRQVSDAARQETEVPAKELLDLPAEIGTLPVASLIPGYWLFPARLKGLHSGSFNPPLDLNLEDLRVRLKKQAKLNLELKPLIAIQSGQYIKHRSCCDDPPTS